MSGCREGRQQHTTQLHSHSHNRPDTLPSLARVATASTEQYVLFSWRPVYQFSFWLSQITYTSFSLTKCPIWIVCEDVNQLQQYIFWQNIIVNGLISECVPVSCLSVPRGSAYTFFNISSSLYKEIHTDTHTCLYLLFLSFMHTYTLTYSLFTNLCSLNIYLKKSAYIWNF